MNAEQHVPPFRFKGFSDFWEQRKLSDLAMFNPRLELPDSFQYVDLESVSGTELINHRTETKSSAPSRAQRLAKKGDIFYQTVRPYQKNNYLYEKSDDDYVFSTGYAQLRPYEDGYFLFSRLQENGFVSTVLDHSTGTSYPAINSNDLAKLEIMVPLNLNEQQAIGKLFRHIDNAIALHQHKLAKLKELKKGYLQKLFPQNGETVPEFRFKGYSDAWEKRKLGELAEFINGRAYKQDELLASGKYPVLRVGNFYTNDNWYYSDLELPEKYYAEKGDLLYTWSATFGPHIWIGPKVIYHYHIWKVALKNLFEKDFALQFFEADRVRLLNSTNGSTMIHVTKKDMESKGILLPDISEQRNIGEFLRKADDLIAATKCKLDLLKKLKKGYLQKMFC